MSRKLSIICLLVVVLFSLTSCARLSFSDRLDCTKYCTIKRCTKNMKVKSSDSIGNTVFGTMTLVDAICVSECSKNCEFCKSDMVIEWKRNKNKSKELNEPGKYMNISGDTLR